MDSMAPQSGPQRDRGLVGTARCLEGESSLSNGSETTGFDEERLLLKRYLSDEIAPLIFADSASELFKVPMDVVVTEIQSWMADQIRGATDMTPADLIFHAATKLHQLGILELIPQGEVQGYLDGLQPHLMELCPAQQRIGLEENFKHLEKSTGMSGAKVEVLRKSGGVGGGRSELSPKGHHLLGVFATLPRKP